MLFHKQPLSPFFSSNAILLSVFVLLSLSCVTTQNNFDISLFQANEKPWVIAHRGGRALFPENTMVAFDGSAALNVDALEMDICITKDGILVTNHDLTIDRTTNGKGKLIDFTFEELQHLNFGHHFKDKNETFSYRDKEVKVTSFESVLKKYGNKIPLIIELKNKSENGLLAANKLVQLLKKYQLEKQVIIGSFHDEVLTHFKQLSDNKIMTSTSIKESKSYVLSRKLALPFLYQPKDAAIQFPMKAKGMNLSRKGFINTAKKRNMLVQYWTINSKENMLKLIKLGVDGIMTDRPDLLLSIYKDMDRK